MIVKCVTAGTSANSEPDLHFCKVDCSEDEFAEGDHYMVAREQAGKDGYEGEMVTFDEHDGPDFLFEHFVWDSATVVKI